MQKLADAEKDMKELKNLNGQLAREIERLTEDRSRVSHKYWTKYRERATTCKELSSQLVLYRASLSSSADLLQHYTVSAELISPRDMS